MTNKKIIRDMNSLKLCLRLRSWFSKTIMGKPMKRGGRFLSMRVKFPVFMIMTALLVLALAFSAIPVALQIFRREHSRPERVEERLESYTRDFAEYVAEGNIRADDAAGVARWTRRNRSVYLTVFNEGDNQFGAAGGELWEGGEQPDMEPFFYKADPSEEGIDMSADANSMVYIVRFANGVHTVAVTDYSLATGTDAIMIGGVLGAVILFFITLMVYYHRQTRAIVTLSREVETISGGDLNATIETRRTDEIGQLAEDVDTMRYTILQKVEERERAWQANSDLLTSMTHDIRTPLTTLLGYMEILGNDNGNLTEEQKAYVRVCTQKAEQIKGLSDKLFLYFWAFNRSENEGGAEAEPFEAALLFEQLIGDYIPAMEAAGLTIATDISAISPTDVVRVRIDCLRRVTDNVFDNMTKYADRRDPVTILAVREEKSIVLSFTNTVSPSETYFSGTRIGVKTCINMMEMMRGQFRTHSDGDTFTATLTLPLQ